MAVITKRKNVSKSKSKSKSNSKTRKQFKSIRKNGMRTRKMRGGNQKLEGNSTRGRIKRGDPGRQTMKGKPLGFESKYETFNELKGNYPKRPIITNKVFNIKTPAAVQKLKEAKKVLEAQNKIMNSKLGRAIRQRQAELQAIPS